jgi:excisionase family DNA binding protein
MADEVMTRVEACAYLKISLPTLKRYIRAGMIPVVKLGRRVLLRKETLDHVLRVHESRRPARVKARHDIPYTGAE